VKDWSIRHSPFPPGNTSAAGASARKHPIEFTDNESESSDHPNSDDAAFIAIDLSDESTDGGYVPSDSEPARVRQLLYLKEDAAVKPHAIALQNICCF
jgi:hypothetical protein